METTQILLLAVAFVIGAAVMFAFTKATTKPSETFTTPIMHDFTIRGMINNYRENQLTFINKNLPLEDAHSVWHSFTEIKNFISSVENESSKVNPDLIDADFGVRFYYAAYPQAEEFQKYGIYGVPDTYALRHTMIMIPTIKKHTDEGIQNFDFNPLDASTYNISSSANNNPTVRMMAMSEIGAGTEGNQLAENHGSLIPPTHPNVEQY